MSTDSISVDQLRERFRAQLARAATDADLKALHDEFLSRKSGAVTGLMKTLGALPPEARREFGQLVNTLKTEIETALDEKRAALEDDFHNCEALNMPPDHPARDMQDTLYLGAPIVGGTWGAYRGKIPEAQV